MWTDITMIIIGLGLLIQGADWLIKGGGALARKYHIPELVIGLTVVAFGTSLPELVVTAFASGQNHQDLILGNVIGSNNFNLFVILGVTGLISPIVVQTGNVWKEIPISILAVILLFLLANNFFIATPGIISRIDGMLLALLFAAFLYYTFHQLKKEDSPDEIQSSKLAGYKMWLFILIGIAGLVIGGHLVVSSAVEVAIKLGISEKIIGLTIIAMGTSLPELVTSVVAIIKKNSDIAVGNIIGSNIFNIFLILSVSSLIRPITYDVKFDIDLFLLAGGTLFLFVAMFTGIRKKLDRWEALVLLVVYGGYITLLLTDKI